MNNGTDETDWNINYLTSRSILEQGPGEDLPPIIMILLIIVGTIGNCLVCLAILRNRNLHNVKNYFLFSLAVTDLLVSLLILPARMVSVRYRFQPATFPMCFLYLIGDDLITAASAIHICLISLMTYASLKCPVIHLSKRRVGTIIGLVWFIAFLSVIPYMTMAIITQHPHQPMLCPELLANFLYFDAILLIEAMIIIAMVIIVVISFILTTNLLRKLIKQQLEDGVADNKGLVKTMNENIIAEDTTYENKNCEAKAKQSRALKITWLVSFTFIISMGPYACVSLFYLAFPHIIIPPLLLDITAYLSYANSVINPFIYTLFDKTFRHAFKHLFSLKKNII